MLTVWKSLKFGILERVKTKKKLEGKTVNKILMCFDYVILACILDQGQVIKSL